MKGGGGDMILTLLLAGGAAYLLYNWYQSQQTVTVGTAANPITVAGASPINSSGVYSVGPMAPITMNCPGDPGCP